VEAAGQLPSLPPPLLKSGPDLRWLIVEHKYVFSLPKQLNDLSVYVNSDVTRLTAIVLGIFVVSVMGEFVRCQRDKGNWIDE